MDSKISYFCSRHVHPQPYDPCREENTSLAFEDWKMKDNCERDEITPRFSVGDHKTITKEGDVVNGGEGYFISYPKEENISYIKTSLELPNELEDKPPPVGCELVKLKDKSLMKRDEHI